MEKIKITYIYVLKDPTNGDIRYVGKTINPDRRMLEHIRGDNKNDYKNSWIKKLLKQGIIPEMEIVDEVNDDCWQFWELFYWKFYKDLGCKLTNLQGCGNSLTRHHPETIKKIRDIAIKNKKVGKEHPNYGKKLSKDSLKKKRETILERYPEGLGKPILKIDINTGEIVNRYLTAGEAAKKNNMRKQRMDELLSGKPFKQGNKIVTRIQNRGFRYLRERDYDPDVDYKVRAGKCRAVAQYSLEGELIKEFERVNDAVEALNIPAPQIVANCRGNQKTCKGFIFKYTD